jgi:hypothetical protein
VLGELEVAVKEVAATDVAGLADDELTEALVGLRRQIDSLEAALARAGDEWNTRRVWADTGARSGPAELARRTRRPKPEWASLLYLGRKMKRLPLFAEAWLAGEVGSAHVRRAASALNPRTAAEMAEHEGTLVGLAMSLRFDDFAQAMAYWELRADPDGASLSDAERRDRRRVSLDETLNGMYSGSVLLDPVSGSAVAGELQRLEQELFEADWAEAKERLGRDPKSGELRRTPDQRRADALVEMAKRSGTAAADGKPPRPLFQLVLGSDQFRHLCELANGRVVSPEAVIPWITDADIERYLFSAYGDRVISVSRRRAFTGALRDLIKVRDRRCFHPSCDARADRCQVDHIEPWAAGGLTAQDNGRLACGVHNRNRGRPPSRE